MKAKQIFYALLITCILGTCALITVSADDRPLNTMIKWTETSDNEEVYQIDVTYIKIYDSETGTMNFIVYDAKASNVAIGLTTIPINDLDVSDERKEELKQKYDINKYDIVYK